MAKKKAVKKTAPKKVTIPSYMKKEVTQFVIGTEDYRKIIEDYNKLSGSSYNTWRVRPAVFYAIWADMKKHFGIK
jgi:hypothetical protein